MAVIGVIGGDVQGLVAACELKSLGHVVKVFAFESPAQSVVFPSFKFLERTTEVQELLERLRVLHESYSVNVGLLQGGVIAPLRKQLSQGVYLANYKKTRLTTPETIPVPPLPDDPEVGSRKHAITMDWFDFARKMYNENAPGFLRVRGVVVEGDRLQVLGSNDWDRFDAFVVAVPLWHAAEIFVDVELPDSMATKIQYVSVNAVRDPYVKWDVVYTPFTPGGLVHRVYHHREAGFVCEFSGRLHEDELQSDLHFLFSEGWHFTEEIVSANGHLIPLTHDPVWPKNVVAVGKHATWDSRSSFTSTIRTARGLAKALNAKP